jgi:hypothetical protein
MVRYDRMDVSDICSSGKSASSSRSKTCYVARRTWDIAISRHKTIELRSCTNVIEPQDRDILGSQKVKRGKPVVIIIPSIGSTVVGTEVIKLKNTPTPCGANRSDKHRPRFSLLTRLNAALTV